MSEQISIHVSKFFFSIVVVVFVGDVIHVVVIIRRMINVTDCMITLVGTLYVNCNSPEGAVIVDDVYMAGHV